MKVLGFLFSLSLHAQIIVSLTLMPSSGVTAQVGKGVGAYEWSIHTCSVGPTAVSWTLVRMEFPEVRFYSKQQQDLILQTRTQRSLPARSMQWAGYFGVAVGVGLSAAQKINKSPSWSGDLTTVTGLTGPAIVALAAKSTPRYTISDPVPDVIALVPGQCADYSALAGFGKAPESIPPRKIDPLSLNNPNNFPKGDLQK